MRFPLADLIDRHPRLQRAREVLSFAGARARDVQMGRAAGSLTFTTLLSMVPLFAVALALFTAFPLFAQFRDELEYFLLKVLPGQISSTVLRYVNEFAAQATRLTALGLAARHPRDRDRARLRDHGDEPRLLRLRGRARDGQARAAAAHRLAARPRGGLLLLASDAGAYMTGSVVVVDGGHLVNSL